MRKNTNSETANSQAIKASNNTDFILDILSGKQAMTPIKPTRKATAEDAKKAHDFLKALQPKKCTCKNIDAFVQGNDFVNDFEYLKTFVLAYFEGATATNKAIRFKTSVARFSVWRRANNVRIYTNNPDDFKGVEWVEDTHEQGLTHSGYTSAKTIIAYLMNE
jgi:hypothetical protein